MSKGKYIEGAVAASLILELFDGQTDVPRQEIERKVAKLYSSRYDFPETIPCSLFCLGWFGTSNETKEGNK